MSEKYIKFELNNWMPKTDYPDCEPFSTWFADDNKIPFACDRWCRENGLKVSFGIIDMSFNFCIVAPLSWVKEKCPKLLTEGKEFIRDKSHWGLPFSKKIGLTWYTDSDGPWEAMSDDDPAVVRANKEWEKDVYGKEDNNNAL